MKMKGDLIALLAYFVFLAILAAIAATAEHGSDLRTLGIGILIGSGAGFMAAHFMHRIPKLRAARKAAETRRRNKANGRSVKNG